MKRPYQIDPRPSRDFTWLPGSTTAEQVMDKLQAMRRMECTTYRRSDYLYCNDSPYNVCASSSTSSSLMKDAMYVLGPISSPPSSFGSDAAPRKKPKECHPHINETTRQYMIDLLYEIGDYCHFRRETVSYSIWNIMDRYLSLEGHKTLQTKADFQLIASTSLYIAVKLLEPVSMDVQSLADLSKGAFDFQDILNMEKHMLFALKWAVAHGPTPIGFVQLYLTLLQMDGLVLSERELWDKLMEQAQYQVELSVVHYSLVTQRKPSEIALAAVWNALESQLDCDMAMQWQNQLMSYLKHVFLDRNTKRSLPKIQLALCKLQYTAEAHSRHVVVVPQGSSLEDTKHNDDEDSLYYYEDECLPDQSQTYEYNEEEEAKLDQTETQEDDDGSPSRYLFPSPVSVATNQLTAHYEPKEEEEEVRKPRESSCHYGVNFIRSLFSFY